VDGQTFADIEAYSIGRWLDELTEELKKKTYRPHAVRRVNIPNPVRRKGVLAFLPAC
jgi:RNA-directed DNA polymerase